MEGGEKLDLDYHVVRVSLPGRAGKRELEALVSRLAATELDPAHPRWQYHLVDNYDVGSALVIRIHHCYADGIALVQVMLSMTDSAPGGPPALPAPPPQRKRASTDSLGALTAPLPTHCRCLGIGKTLVEKGTEIGWTRSRRWRSRSRVARSPRKSPSSP